MLSDPVLLALIATITPTVTAIGSLIIALRTSKKLDIDKAQREVTEKARGQKQRKTDSENDKDHN